MIMIKYFMSQNGRVRISKIVVSNLIKDEELSDKYGRIKVEWENDVLRVSNEFIDVSLEAGLILDSEAFNYVFGLLVEFEWLRSKFARQELTNFSGEFIYPRLSIFNIGGKE